MRICCKQVDEAETEFQLGLVVKCFNREVLITECLFA